MSARELDGACSVGMKGRCWRYLAERFIDDVWVLEVVVGEEVELVQEVPDIDAA